VRPPIRKRSSSHPDFRSRAWGDEKLLVDRPITATASALLPASVASSSVIGSPIPSSVRDGFLDPPRRAGHPSQQPPGAGFPADPALRSATTLGSPCLTIVVPYVLVEAQLPIPRYQMSFSHSVGFVISRRTFLLNSASILNSFSWPRMDGSPLAGLQSVGQFLSSHGVGLCGKSFESSSDNVLLIWTSSRGTVTLPAGISARASSITTYAVAPKLARIAHRTLHGDRRYRY